MPQLTDDDIRGVLESNLKDPFSVLGRHPAEDGGWQVRAFFPEAESVSVLPNDSSPVSLAMTRVHEDGFFEATIKNDLGNRYRLEARYADGSTQTFYDAYAFLPVMSEEDRKNFQRGNLFQAYEHLGAHVREVEGVEGVHFAVWAPSAKRVSVVGSFNDWDGRRHMMRLLGDSGIWEIFVPGLGHGEIYKFEIKKSENDHLILKSDPYGYCHQGPPDHAAIVTDLDRFKWTDEQWMDARKEMGSRIDRPLNVYEVHLGSWRRRPEEMNRRLDYRELAHELGEYVQWMGYTHVELLPVAEHPLEASWGYQVTGYYSVQHRHGTPEDFQYFVNHLHELGIGVIMDWVPAHFPRDAHGLAHFDGTHLYEHADPRQGEHKDWGTLIFNFGRHEVRNFLVANALFWLEKFHIDGLRVDAVASMLYNDYSRKDGEWVANEYGGKENLAAIRFLQQANAEVHGRYPGVLMIAEESTDWPGVTKPTYLGGLGFTFKWNMGWMHDSLFFFTRDPVYRKYHMNQVTFGLWYAFQENWILSLSHDEVVHGKCSMLNKMPGDRWQKFSNLRMLFGFMMGHPGKKLNFMGAEFGQWKEWTHDTSLDWHETNDPLNGGLQRYVRDLNHLYLNHSAFWDQDERGSGFKWVDFSDAENTTCAFLRFGYDWHNCLLVICNFTPIPRHDYRVGVPHGGRWEELLNSDAAAYGGSGVGNWGGFHSEQIPWQGFAYSLNLHVPPLGCLVLQWKR